MPTKNAVTPKVNLRHLHAFLAVTENGSINRASDKLYRATSAITRSIIELEQTLGVRLFERKARGMLPSASGKVVLIRALRIEKELREAFMEATAVKSGSIGLSNQSAMWCFYNTGRLLAFTMLTDMRHMPSVAQALGRTQPAISGAIRELETSLKQTLFQRNAKGMVTTEVGTLLAIRIKRVLSELRHIEEDLAALSGVMLGHIAIGALPLCRTLILPDAMAATLAAYPKLQMSTSENSYSDLCVGLRSGEIDFIIGAIRESDDSPDLDSEILFYDSISLIARKAHPLAGVPNLGFDEIRVCQWVLSRRGTPSRELLDFVFASAEQAKPVPAVETGDLAILRGLLFKSDMVTAISAYQLHYEIEAGNLVVLDFPFEITRRAIGITIRRDAYLSPATNILIKQLRAVCSKDNFDQYGVSPADVLSR